MKKKSVLLSVKNTEAVDNYMRMIRNKKYDDEQPYSKEVRSMIEEFSNNEWIVYLGTLDNFDTKNDVFNKIYCVQKDGVLDMKIDQINEDISIMIIRNVGSVEQKFEEVQTCLKYLIDKYEGIVINNPKAMLKGMTKHYLTEIELDELEKIGVVTIPTQIFDNSVTINKIYEEYPEHRENYLIKPVTGELSNSLKCLGDIDEEFLRHKENKVGGWVIQPIQKEIWKGEYQLLFLDKKLIYSQEKNYTNVKDEIPDQKKRIISKYEPSEQEVESGTKLVEYFERFYNLSIDICRIDFMKTDDGRMKLLEFEMVNPGFFIGYMKEHDIAIKNITTSIRKYCENRII